MRVEEREDPVRQDAAQLHIEIDETKRKEDVQELAGAGCYLRLKDKIKKMREGMSNCE